MNPKTARTALVLALLASVLAVPGCVGLFNTEPFVDARKDENGNLVFLDTPRMWRDWVDVIDSYVADELAGDRPPGGVTSWNYFWIDIIRSNSSGRENSPRYISYIVEKRRAARLPELEGYP